MLPTSTPSFAKVFACGDHSSGQLGIGAGPKMSPQLRPVRVGQAQAVSAGFRHSAAVCGASELSASKDHKKQPEKGP